MATFEERLAATTTPLQGGNLPATTLPQLVSHQRIVILHFLRHLGCIYCRHSVDQLHRLTQENPRFPPLVFVHPASAEAGQAFFDERYPGAAHLADPKLELYRLFGINRLTPGRLLNPKGIQKGLKLVLSGYSNAFVNTGNPWVLSGTFLFFDGKLRWQHRAQYAGDDPNWNKVAQLGQAAAANSPAQPTQTGEPA